LGERSEAQKQSRRKTPNNSHRDSADSFAVSMKRRKVRAEFSNPVPVFGSEMTASKIQTVKGLSLNIFSRSLRKNTTLSLTVSIG